jgi:predicted metal-dependent hydrolase
MIRVCLSRRALARVRERLDYFIPLVGRTPNRVAIRNQSTRWGSCSSKGNLNFNWKLVLAPPEALDYVVAHELCHLLEFSHSPNFWKLVEKAFPDYKFWKKWLKDHGKELGV